MPKRLSNAFASEGTPATGTRAPKTTGRPRTFARAILAVLTGRASRTVTGHFRANAAVDTQVTIAVRRTKKKTAYSFFRYSHPGSPIVFQGKRAAFAWKTRVL